MGKQYRNPPIVEALCEFRFEPGAPWDMAIPGLVYEGIRDSFPKRRQAKTFEVSVAAGPGGIEQQVVTTDRMQFLREDEKALIQVGPNLLAVNHLKPYPTWRGFLPLIRQGFNAYLAAANPKGIQRIGLRYINRIELPGKRVELADYLEFRPFVGERLPQDYGPFIVGIQIPFEASRDFLRLQLASAVAGKPETVALMLDLDYFLAQPSAVSQDQVFDWIKLAHDHVEEVFEACITERLRQMFEEVTGK
ncbi:MAG: TIGR04255 family protein [Chloroflexi bacterium]|nr:TIGR04255 family protein [Chloroflexota bacterium]